MSTWGVYVVRVRELNRIVATEPFSKAPRFTFFFYLVILVLKLQTWWLMVADLRPYQMWHIWYVMVVNQIRCDLLKHLAIIWVVSTVKSEAWWKVDDSSRGEFSNRFGSICLIHLVSLRVYNDSITKSSCEVHHLLKTFVVMIHGLSYDVCHYLILLVTVLMSQQTLSHCKILLCI